MGLPVPLGEAVVPAVVVSGRGMVVTTAEPVCIIRDGDGSAGYRRIGGGIADQAVQLAGG